MVTKSNHHFFISVVLFEFYIILSILYKKSYQIFHVVPTNFSFLSHVIIQFTQFKFLTIIKAKLVTHLDKRMNEFLLPFIFLLQLVQALFLLQKFELMLANLFF
jgi:hypothetical protein